MALPLLIGIDVGTTAVKAALIAVDGSVIARFSERYPTTRSAPDHVEQEADDWLQRVEKALHYFAGHPAAQAVQGLGLTSQVNTHVFVDAKGKALMPAIVWQDGRCAREAASLDLQVSEAERLAWWGAPLPIDASHPLARMTHVKTQRPDIWHKTRWVLAPKDLCLLHLTGAVAADPMTNFGLIDQSLRYVPKLTGLVECAADKLPPLHAFAEPIGKVKSGLPFAGTPVVTGSMDAWAGLLGAGVSRDGEAVYLTGTSEILSIVSRARVPTPGVIAFPECEGIVLHAGPTQAGGASIEWLSRMLGRSPDELSALAGVATGTVPLFLPHLQGERAPVWDAASRGSFALMDTTTGAAEIARAVFEGVAYSARWLFETLEKSADCKPALIHHSGGGSASDLWCQIRADVLGRPIRRMAMRDAGVLGAALLAGVGAGLFPSIDQAARSFVVSDSTFEPEPQQTARHDARFAAYRQLYAQLKPLHL
jgi:xylulokinase